VTVGRPSSFLLTRFAVLRSHPFGAGTRFQKFMECPALAGRGRPARHRERSGEAGGLHPSIIIRSKGHFLPENVLSLVGVSGI
jgi:hypothetical protein